MSPTAETAFERRLFVCKGRRASKGELFAVLAPVDDAGEISGEDGLYSLKKSKGVRTAGWYAGGVYSIEASGTSVRSFTSQYVRRFEDAALVGEWQTETRLAEVEIEQERENKKNAERDELKEALRPWREQYFKTISHARRLSLDLLVLHALHAPVNNRP